MANITMEEILNSSFGETASEVKASFRKTVYVRQYETEVVEISSKLTFDKPLTGPERMLASAILQAQLEYEACCSLTFKGFMNQSELNNRKAELIAGVAAVKSKAEELAQKSLTEFINSKQTE